MKPFARVAVVAMALGGQCSAAFAQQGSGPTEWQRVLRMPAVSGYEQNLSEEIRKRLRELSPRTDNIGNVYISVGSGAPHRLVVTPIDEPGYIVSEITEQGYVRVQRLPQLSPNDVFDMLSFAQPVTIQTRGGRQVSGVFSGLSLPLQFDRTQPPAMNPPDKLYVDIGASSADEVRKAGIDLLNPVVLERNWFLVGRSGTAGPAVGDRFGAYAVVQLLEQIHKSHLKGTTTIAFLAQQWLGGRGLSRILTETAPDELIYLGRLRRESDSMAALGDTRPGSGVLIGTSAAPSVTTKSLAAHFQAIAEIEHIPTHLVTSKEPIIPEFGEGILMPERWVVLSVPTFWPVTPGEFVAEKDIAQLSRLIAAYLDIPKPPEAAEEIPVVHRNYRRPEALIDTYGVAGHEEEIREVVSDRLDPRLRKMASTDANGNLVLHFGDGKKEEKTPRILFVAHMDEIGYEVRKIESDGRLQVELLGNAHLQYYLGHVVLVHKNEGRPVGGVLELPVGWDQPGFELPNPAQPIHEPLHVFVGTYSKEETEKLGIAAGDSVTVPKKYHQLLGLRVSGRSLDDRVGCSALITAANALGPDFSGHDVTFVWSVGKELGSKGATMFAEQAVEQHRVPDFVFAIDSFATSDSPVESRRSANAKLGKGFVVLALDNSNAVPPQYLYRVVALANEDHIPFQYGVTGGQNEGAAFLRYGSVDVPLGWPILYSNSPAEEIDTQDMNALAKIVETIAREW